MLEHAMSAVFVYITTESPEQAERIGRTLVEARLAACVNILPGMRSIYHWQGRIESASETVLIAKTRQALTEALLARVKALHSYAVPCAVVLSIQGGLPDFLDWIEAETGPQNP
jgi:periplasmic divalent cation tolerance protein